jgi:uncharacterized membrane protein YraQ (UPF0718 family)
MLRKILRKIGGNYLFLIAVCILYIVLAAVHRDTARAGFTAFLKLLTGIAPVLGIVFILLFISNLTIDSQTVVRYLGRQAGKVGWFVAIIAGIISAGPIYLWYPLLSDLKDTGMREGLIAVFLYNRAVKVPMIPMMILYFGVKTVVILTIYMIIFSVLNGYLVERIVTGRRGN